MLLCVPAGGFAQETTVPQSEAQIQLSFSPLVKKVAPSVVNIYTKRVVARNVHPFANDPFFRQFFGRSFGGMTRNRVESALGSGVIIKEDGLIVSNAHVVKDATEITVALLDGREFEAEKVLVDEPSDLALLKITADDETFPFVELRPSEGLEVGDLVLAIGNPFGVGQTVTSGIVSAQGRASLNINDFNFFIQTDAAINPGNSGGPLVAMDGGVVGINTAIFSRSGGSLGLGFAVPSEMLATVVAAYESGQVGDKAVVRPWLGMTGQGVTSDIAQSLGLSTPHGVLVAALHAQSPAAKAGLKAGDLITAMDGRLVKEPAALKFRMATVPLGQKARFTVLRDGQEKEYDILAMAPPDVPGRDTRLLKGYNPFSGVHVMNLNPAVATELGIPLPNTENDGVVVADVDSGTRAVRLFAQGDRILQVNGQDVTSTKQLARFLENTGRAGAWQIVIERGGQTHNIVIR